MIHKIWRVKIGSRDRTRAVHELPILGTYLVESSRKNGLPSIEKKAMRLAESDGIASPIVLSCEWINTPYNIIRDELP